MAAPIRLTVQVGTTWLVMLAAYVWMPTARVKLGPAAIGAGVAAVLWEIGKSLLAGAIPNMFEGQLAIYGSLALVPMLLFWVYVTWLIVLFGLELAYAIQTLNQSQLRRQRRVGGSDSASPAVLEPVGMASLAAHLAARFAAGVAPTAGELARAARVASPSAVAALSAFERAGIARRVSETGSGGSDGETLGADVRYTLARPAERIGLGEVLLAARGGSGEGATDGGDDAQAIGPVVLHVAAACSGLTIGALAERLAEADAEAGTGVLSGDGSRTGDRDGPVGVRGDAP